MPKHAIIFLVAGLVLLLTLTLIMASPFPFLGIITGVITIGFVLWAALEMEQFQRLRDMHKK